MHTRKSYIAGMSISEFLSPIHIEEIAGEDRYKKGQIGNTIRIYEEDWPETDNTEICIVGCGEQRGAGVLGPFSAAPEAIRKQFYSLFYWHENVKLVDIGNVIQGTTYADTLAALQTVVSELTSRGNTVIVLGGSQDLTLAQYNACKNAQTRVEITSVDALIDLDMDSPFKNDHFLMEMFTGEPNYVQHYNHIGFQSYFVHPGMLQTLHKLKFDFYRIGHVKEGVEEMEPVIRNSSIFSFDMNAIANAYAPANELSPNGLNGEEACLLMQYAGMGACMQSVGIYGYDPHKDRENLTAKQISQMLWYFIDGRYRRRKEAPLTESHQFSEYRIAFSEIETTFLQSKKTGRWWMQLPDQSFIPCSYKDYVTAGKDEMPERWFRAQQR